MKIKLTRLLFSHGKEVLINIMRSFIFLMCLSAFSITPNNVLSQDAKIKIDKNKELTVDEVFDLIMSQTDYTFIYQVDMFKDYPKVDVKKGTVKANRLLEKSLAKGHFNFNISANNTITIRESKSVQELEVSGTVTDINGVPLAGITVYVSSREPASDNISSDFMIRGTSTDFDGTFTLKAEVGYYLIASGLGYEFYKTQITANQTVYSISLKEKASTLDEVVIVGYGSTLRKDLTGAVASIKNEEILEYKSQTLDASLAGKLTGVQVFSTGARPGQAGVINIRGLSSIRGDNQPLYVIDGVPFTATPSLNGDEANTPLFLGANVASPLAGINPDVIESISVLKDASSAAIYGSRAANGVVIITTKRGKYNQKPQFQYSNSFSIQNPVNTFDYLNAAEYKAFVSEQVPRLAALPFPTQEVLAYEADPDNFFGNADEDWNDLVTNDNAFWSQHSFTVSGGSEKVNYFLNAGIQGQEGTVINNKINRYNLSGNIDAQVNDKFKVGGSFNYNYLVNKISGIVSIGSSSDPSATKSRPDFPAFNENGGFGSVPFFTPDGPDSVFNALGDLGSYKSKNIAKNLFGAVYAEYQIIKNLKFKSQISIGVNDDVGTVFTPSFTTRIINSSLDGATLVKGSNSGWNSAFENTLNYNGTINKDHKINAIAGLSYNRNRFDSESIQFRQFPDDEILIGSGDATIAEDNRNEAFESVLNSVFGRVKYNYKDKYLVTGTLRYDTSTKFGPENQAGYFPAIGLAWNMHNETFLENNSAINQLKLRASLGRTGQDNVGAFAFTSIFGSGNFYTGLNGTAVTGLANSLLKWETTDQLDLGVEVSLFNNRLTADVGYFEKNTNDIILFLDVAPQNGSPRNNQNIGEVSNKGWEISISGDVVRSKNFTWNSAFNISFIKNNIEKLNNATLSVTGNLLNVPLKEGQELGSIVGGIVVGLAETQQQIDDLNAAALAAGAPTGVYHTNLTEPGGYILKDTDGNGYINDLDQQNVLGTSNPDYFGGWTNRFTYKNFDLNINFQFVEGISKIFRLYQTDEVLITENQVKSHLNEIWSPTNLDGTLPPFGSRSYNDGNTSASVFDTSYIRLRSISLGYQFPQKILKTIGVSNAKLMLSGNNLFTITDYPGLDPEDGTNDRRGNVSDVIRDNGNSYPLAKIFTIGLNVTF
ncbi:TonB-dependent receptor [Flavivirga amylovorans]|uniref:TonB-dependent receptor n=1 Tax=Flavivirga amylovorans TaxID=870486 RepID=A0ABT8WW27_9FLAO|nr:TonB-dependent receptor [Flavivirga amylovorans]MDO5985812.1 TonB-dependent receptor [Flavivirga amylovorans]